MSDDEMTTEQREDPPTEADLRGEALLTARDALRRPGFGIPPPAPDDLIRLATWILDGNAAEDIGENWPWSRSQALNPAAEDRAYTIADMARAWREGYTERPLFDGNNVGNAQAVNPYDGQTVRYGDWTTSEGLSRAHQMVADATGPNCLAVNPDGLPCGRPRGHIPAGNHRAFYTNGEVAADWHDEGPVIDPAQRLAQVQQERSDPLEEHPWDRQR